jgi:hypothetical protein
VSNVADMTFMFCFALTFNQDINGWDVSNVINHYAMFGGGCPIDNLNKPLRFQTPSTTCIGSGCTISGGRGGRGGRGCSDRAKKSHRIKRSSRKGRRTKKRGTRRRRM